MRDDHLDKRTIKQLESTHKNVSYYVPMGLKRILRSWEIPDSRITELDWNKQVRHPESSSSHKTDPKLEVSVVDDKSTTRTNIGQDTTVAWSISTIDNAQKAVSQSKLKPATTELCPDDMSKSPGHTENPISRQHHLLTSPTQLGAWSLQTKSNVVVHVAARNLSDRL